MRVSEIKPIKLNEAQMYFGGFAHRPSREETTKYMRGWCPYFALAVFDLYGWQIVGTVEHFANRLPDGRYVDVRGIMDQDDFFDGLGSRETYDQTRNDLVEELETGMYKCGLYELPMLKKAIRFVKGLGVEKIEAARNRAGKTHA